MTTGTSSQFIGGRRPPTSIVNGYSSGGVQSGNSIRSDIAGNSTAKRILSGALTATVYKEILAITGAGDLKLLTAMTVNATARTIGLKVVIDGATVFDAVSSSISASDIGLVAIGHKTNIASDFSLDSIPFNVSLSVQVKSSLSETDFVAIETSYILV